MATQRDVDILAMQINETIKKQKGIYSNYSVKSVSWNDCQRSKIGGKLSCPLADHMLEAQIPQTPTLNDTTITAPRVHYDCECCPTNSSRNRPVNMTNTTLEAKDGRKLYTIRPENFNEKLACVDASQVQLVHEYKSMTSLEHELGETYGRNIALNDFLEENNLFNFDLDSRCSIRFQTTFLPISDKEPSIQFSGKHFNYQTIDERYPRNLILMSTSQGLALKADGVGPERIFHRKLEKKNEDCMKNYWLKAEKTDFEIGGEQKESSSKIIGTKEMGERINAVVTVQIPLNQQPPLDSDVDDCEFTLFVTDLLGKTMRMKVRPSYTIKEVKTKISYFSNGWVWHVMRLYFASKELEDDRKLSSYQITPHSVVHLALRLRGGGGLEGDEANSSMMPTDRTRRPHETGEQWRQNTDCEAYVAPLVMINKSNAARISCGDPVENSSHKPVPSRGRHPTEHITITVNLYHTILNGVPKKQDIVKAIDEMEKLYEKCGNTGFLADTKFDFVTKDQDKTN